MITLRVIATEAGYWLRPYDQSLDRRRWRWQARGRCGRIIWAELSDEQKAELVDAVDAAAKRAFGPDTTTEVHE